MGESSKIEWTDATWNSWYGCHKISQGCKNCYMYRDMPRFGKDPNTVVRSKTTFYDPLKWKEPRRIFTCSWSDFFIEEADPWRDEAFAIMALTPQHTYQVLTKRPERMLQYMSERSSQAFPRSTEARPLISYQLGKLTDVTSRASIQQTSEAQNRLNNGGWPLPNVLLGVSVEDQKTADERIPLLLQTPATKRFLSVEPLLGPVDLKHFLAYDDTNGDGEFLEENGWAYDSWSGGFMGPNTHNDSCYAPEPGIHWVIAGGESGPDARPMHPDWVRSIRDQCNAAGVPFFFKQWGEYAYVKAEKPTWPDGSPVPENCSPVRYMKLGKKKAGRILDGRTWDEMPEVSL